MCMPTSMRMPMHIHHVYAQVLIDAYPEKLSTILKCAVYPDPHLSDLVTMHAHAHAHAHERAHQHARSHAIRMHHTHAHSSCACTMPRYVIFTEPTDPAWAPMAATVEELRGILRGTGAVVLDCGARQCEVFAPGGWPTCTCTWNMHHARAHAHAHAPSLEARLPLQSATGGDVERPLHHTDPSPHLPSMLVVPDRSWAFHSQQGERCRAATAASWRACNGSDGAGRRGERCGDAVACRDRCGDGQCQRGGQESGRCRGGHEPRRRGGRGCQEVCLGRPRL